MIHFIKGLFILMTIAISFLLVSCVPFIKVIPIAELDSNSILPQSYDLKLKDYSAGWTIAADIKIPEDYENDNTLTLEVHNTGTVSISFPKSIGNVEYIEPGENKVIKIYSMKDANGTGIRVPISNERDKTIQFTLRVSTSKPLTNETIQLEAVMTDGF